MAIALGFTGGTAGTSGVVGFGHYTTDYLVRVNNAAATGGPATAGVTRVVQRNIGDPLYIRVVAKANGDYTCLSSVDGDDPWLQNWTGTASGLAATSATHMGFIMAWTGGGGQIQTASFAYLRVYEADLS